VHRASSSKSDEQQQLAEAASTGTGEAVLQHVRTHVKDCCCYHQNRVMSHSWQPPGHPYQVPQRTASEISNHNSPRSHQAAYYPQISPPIYNPPPQSVTQGSSLYQTHSADAYTFVDQVGNPTTVPVVSRHQVLVSGSSIIAYTQGTPASRCVTQILLAY
jgi:hypothetical protein